MSDSEVDVMILAASTDNHLPSATLIDATCGHKCWIAPSGLDFLAKRPEVRTSCMPCMGMTPHEFIYAGTLGRNRMMPGQKKELEETYGKQEADRLFRLLNLEDGGV